MSAGAFKNIFLSLNFTTKHTRQRLFALVIHGVIGWFFGAVAWRTLWAGLRGLRHGCDNS